MGVVSTDLDNRIKEIYDIKKLPDSLLQEVHEKLKKTVNHFNIFKDKDYIDFPDFNKDYIPLLQTDSILAHEVGGDNQTWHSGCYFMSLIASVEKMAGKNMSAEQIKFYKRRRSEQI